MECSDISLKVSPLLCLHALLFQTIYLFHCVCVCSWKCAGVCDRRSVTQTLRALLELHNSFVAYMFVACVLMCMCISVSVFAAASEVNVSYCEYVAMETTDITG